MATIEVTTWAELLAGIAATGTNTVKIMNDIDCNDEIPTGVASTIAMANQTTIDGSYTEEVNGVTVTKNRVIRNLRTSLTSPVPIFNRATNPCTFNNVDFVNLILDSYFMVVTGNKDTTFNSCRFVGRRSTAMFNMSTGTSSYKDLRTIFNSCFFDIPNTAVNPSIYNFRLLDKNGSNTTNRDTIFTTANYCWFRETDDGITFSMPAVQSYNFQKNGCYTDGSIAVLASLSSDEYVVSGDAGKIDLNQSYGTLQSVYDITTNIYTADTSYPLGSVTITAGKGLFKKLGKYGGSEIDHTKFVNGNPDYTIFATTTQMTDAAALSGLGFDITVPNE